MALIKTIDTQKLSNWLKEGKKITILDIRPIAERNEWYIPNSIHIKIYESLKSGNVQALDDVQIDNQIPVVTLCAGGNLSKFATEILASKGFDAYSLEGGMKAWNYAYDTAVLEFENFKIIQIRRVAKGCLSYIIGSGNKAIVIDASLDPSIYDTIAKTEGWKIDFVTDTHIHAGYVSRTKDLANYSGAKHLMNSNASVSYSFTPLEDNELLKIGEIEIKVIHTPGHTWESTSYSIDNKVLLTGDTLFTDGIGRPDLKADEEEAIRKSTALYNSLQLINTFPDETLILPAHISQSIVIGQPIIAEKLKKLKKSIPALTFSVDNFVKSILSKLPVSPLNYLTIAEINKSGDIGNFIVADLEAGANRCAIK
jgi:glyoxylase-like metal-dependent hydrolase (beta-lactamase superfamily II)/rhodanese-related sulfurtransferase